MRIEHTGIDRFKNPDKGTVNKRKNKTKKQERNDKAKAEAKASPARRI